MSAYACCYRSFGQLTSVDLDGCTVAGVVLIVSIVLLLDIDWSMRLQSVDGDATKSTENKNKKLCGHYVC